MLRLRALASVVLAALLLLAPASAEPPGDVAPTLRFASDGATLTWDALAGAERYDVYRGTAPDGSDLACFVFRTPATSAGDAALPAPGALLTYVVGAWNADGAGPLGAASDGTPRTAAVRCADDDGDGVRDDQDLCPGIADPLQADQDGDGLGDACDAKTYDFEADAPGARPAGVTQDGEVDATFVVRVVASEQGVSYDGGVTGVHDRFDRLALERSYQDVDVYVDVAEASGEALTIEAWSDGTWAENAGGGVQVRIEGDGTLTARLRRGREFAPLGSASLATTDRLRLRLRKGAGTTSTLAVDRFAGGAWLPNEATFTIDDDTRLRGTALAIVNLDGGRRALLRVTGDDLLPEDALTLLETPSGLAPWKLYQRGPDGTAPIAVPFAWRSGEPARLEVRLVDETSGLPLAGFDFIDHGVDLAAAPQGAQSELALEAVPAGGNYTLEARLVAAEGGAILGEASVAALAVGDVWLAAGQSNMSGYSGVLDPAEEPSPRVHLFGNDYRWKLAAEPMDSGVDQVDRVSEESPAHTLMLRFGKVVSDAIGVPVAIIPAPLSGTNLFSQWQRRADDPANRGTLYGSSVHRVLAQEYVHPIRGVIWYQGESDVGRGTAVYRQDLENLVANWRADLGASELFFGNCQLATNLFASIDGWVAIQEAQRQQAEADPLSVVVALLDQPRSDSIHLNVLGYKTAGERLARAVLDELYGIPQNLGPQIVSIRYGVGARNRVLVEYDEPVTGGATALYRFRDSGGPATILTATTSGNTVTIDLQRTATTGGVLSYGYALNPSTLMIKAQDGSGAALAFQDVPIAQ